MEKPILFNSLMVQAILEGKKTCTRRIVKGNVNGLDLIGTGSSKCNDTFDMMLFGKLDKEKVWNSDVKERVKAPFMPGDILYVRETWFEGYVLDFNENVIGEDIVLYRADDLSKYDNELDTEEIRWKPSIHMPRRLARIFLEVTEVHVERLQDITEDEAIKEGIRAYTKDGEVFKYASNESQYKWSEMPRNPIEPFKKLWDSCYNWPKCWEYNPWVWVITFKKINKDEVNKDE